VSFSESNTTPGSVSGRIGRCYSNWERIKASPFVLGIVKEGYHLPFLSLPNPFLAKSNQSSLREAPFVEDTIEQLLLDNCIKEVSTPPTCLNSLTVASGHKLRLVLDLIHVNKFLQIVKFKYENLKTVAELFEKDFYFISFDLKSGYHHISIHEDHFTYLGFSWTYSNGTTKYFVFVVLPLGLGSACYAFTKLLRPLMIKRWRSLGIRSVLYLDDGIAGGSSINYVERVRNLILKDLASLGLTVNLKKSHLVPTQFDKWLGFCIDTKKMEFSVPEEKLNILLQFISQLLERGTANAKNLAKVTGHIISMSPAIGPLTRLMTRQAYKFIENSASWFRPSCLPEGVLTELHFWLENIKKSNGYRIKHNPTVTQIAFSDASGSGYGGYIIEKQQKFIACGKFTFDETKQSSTYRELLAVKLTLQSFSKILSKETVMEY